MSEQRMLHRKEVHGLLTGRSRRRETEIEAAPVVQNNDLSLSMSVHRRWYLKLPEGSALDLPVLPDPRYL